MFDTLTILLDWLGIAVFATTGALVASRKEMDIIGFLLLAALTGIGGGTIRDLLLGLTPVFWILRPEYLATCLAVATLTYFFAHIPQSRYRYLLWLDALGLALFAVIGAERTLEAGAGPMVAVTMGVITATFGGILRDILGGEPPVILSQEIYLTAALAGALVFTVMASLGLPRDGALAAGFAAAFALRAAALHWGLTLPRYRPRPGRNPEDL